MAVQEYLGAEKGTKDAPDEPKMGTVAAQTSKIVQYTSVPGNK